MKRDPVISVVMGVHNGEGALSETLDSVLGQQDVDLEFIVVDDGSTDRTPQLLAARADRDPRLRIIREPENRGLTEALIRGCAAARGEFIARQDCGDRSLPGRLKAQVSYLLDHPRASGVDCGTSFHAPCGLLLFTVSRRDRAWQEGLAVLDVDRIKGPSHHGATCFRSAAYREAGGYRQHFRVAQDLDLWLRLAELGELSSIPEILYKAEVSVGGISTEKRPLQFAYARQAIQAAVWRRAGLDDAQALARHPELRDVGQTSRAEIVAGFNYFIGAALLARGNKPGARRYLRESILLRPFAPKAWVKLVQAWL